MTVSVVIPVYNGEKFAMRCLDALAKQTHPPDEVIVVDDGSTDQNVALVESDTVHVIRQKHQGPAAARNTGIRSARGEMILFTDIDCEAHPSWVMEMEKSLSIPEVVGVKGAYATRQAGIVPRLVQYEFEERYDLMEKSPTIDFIDTYSAGFRSDILRQMGGFDTALQKNEDVELSYRLASAGKKLIFNRKAIVFHHHPEGWFTYFTVKAKKAYWRTIVYRLHPGKAIKDTYTPQLLKFQILLALSSLLMVIPAWRWYVCIWIASILWGGLLLSTIPFVRRVWQSDPTLAGWGVVFILVRSYAFVIGVISGILGLMFFKPKIHRLTS